MELFLIRHAQSENNARPQNLRVEDPGITDLGQKQAALLAEWIPQLQLTHLVTSPFLRTLQTTEPIARATGLTPIVKTALHELGGCVSGRDWRKMEGRPGMSREEIRRGFPSYDVGDEITDDGWWNSQPYELMHMATTRAADLLAETQRELGATDARVAFVMHADIKLLFLQLIDRSSFDSIWNAAVSKITVTEEEAVLEDFNRTDHIPADLHTK